MPATQRKKTDIADKKQLKTPYTKLRDAAKQNAELKHSKGGVQVRVGLMLLGIFVAGIIYAFPNLFSQLDEKTKVDQGKCLK